MIMLADFRGLARVDIFVIIISSNGGSMIIVRVVDGG